MPKLLICLLLALSCAVSGTLALAQEVAPPKLKYVMTYQANLDPPQVVAKDELIFNVTGGWIRGANGDTGVFLNPCGDWLAVQPNGNLRLDVRCTLRMDDGSLIFIEYNGVIKMTKEGADKFQRGERINVGDWYFMTAPTMRSMSEKYAWVNDRVFIEKMVAVQPSAEGKQSFVRYDVYAVEP